MTPAIKKSMRFIAIILTCFLGIYRLIFYEVYGSLEIPEEFTGKPLIQLGVTENDLLKIRKIHKVENESVSYSYDEEYKTELSDRILYVFKRIFGTYKLQTVIIQNNGIKDIEYVNEKQSDSIAQLYEKNVRAILKLCVSKYGSNFRVYKSSTQFHKSNLTYYDIIWETSSGWIKMYYYPPQTVKSSIRLGESSYRDTDITYESEDLSLDNVIGVSECSTEERKQLGF